eukprot:Rhum_TRINITY_DN15035_c3_g1::Rhum_TRINITY_DN15035_c3_g1_i1::g.134799::m.134799
MAEDWAAAEVAFHERASDAASAATCGSAAASTPAPAERAFAETLRIVSRLVSVGVEGGAAKAAGRPLFARIVAVLLSPAAGGEEEEDDGVLCRVLTSLLGGGLLDGQLLRGRGGGRGGAAVPPGVLDAVRCACGCASVAVGLLLLRVETGRGDGRRVFDRLARVLTALLAWGDAAAAALRATQRRRAGLRGSASA